MLTRLIVASYAWLLEAALWLTIAIAAVVGYHLALPMLTFAGAVPMNLLAWKLLGAALCPAVTFLVLAIFAGPLLVLVDIRQAVRQIAARVERETTPRADAVDMRYSPPRRREEPTL